jgi:hypothetical protein
VLDDVWNENREKWSDLKRLLMGGSKGSKVVITTRSRLVAKITSTISPYFLKGLSKTNLGLYLSKWHLKKGKRPLILNLKKLEWAF